MESIGIIAGNREFPLLVAKSARREGVRRLYAVGFPGITSKALPKLVDEMAWVGLGQLGKLVKFFEGRNVKTLMMVGQIPHRLALRSLKFDLEGLHFFRSQKEKNAKTMLGGLIQQLEEKGFEFIDSTRFLKDELATEGALTQLKPNDEMWDDLSYGFRLARRLADLEAGQTVIVKNGVLVALEGMEGTDAAILRGGELAGKGIVVVKSARARQDMRYDVPVVGLETLRALKKARAAVLGIEACRTLILSKKEFIKEAEKMGLAVVGLGESSCKS